MQAVILAGGRSSRFWPLNTRHKSLTRIGGRTLLEHTLHGMAQAGITDIVIVQGPDRHIEQCIDAPADTSITFTVQPEPNGMGDALEQAREHVDSACIVSGPYRFDAKNMVGRMRSALETFDGAVAGAETRHPERYGMLSLSADRERATGIVEKPDPEDAPSRFKAVSTYLLTPDFFNHLDAVEKHEYHFEDALDRYMQEQDVAFIAVDEEPPSLKYPWDLFDFTERILDDQEQHIAESATIHDNVTIDGPAVIADNVTIYENAVIRGPCYIGAGSTVGNNAVVRHYTSIGRDCTVGANAEIRGSVIQDGFSCHSGFIGDSLIGRNVSIGAGVVTANRMVRNTPGDVRDRSTQSQGRRRPDVSVYVREKDEHVDTGRNRLGMIVGDEADIGTCANIMPGVCIGAGSFIGPSTFVRHNVGERKQFFTRTEGTEMERDRNT